MAYHLPIIVGKNKNRRLVMVHLLSTQEQKNYQENRVIITTEQYIEINSPYVISQEGGGKVSLIKDMGELLGSVFETNDANAKSAAATNTSKEVNNAPQTENVENLLTVIKTSQPDEQETPVQFKTSKDGDDEHARAYYEPDNGGTDFIYKFKLTDAQNKQFVGTIHIVSPQNASYVTIDYGSDATQVNVLETGNFTAINIVNQFETKYNARNYGRNSAYLQTEDGGVLYKTGYITLGAKGNLDKDFQDKPDKPKESSDKPKESSDQQKNESEEYSFINYLNTAPGQSQVSDKEEPYTVTLPNLKIAYQANVPLPRISVYCDKKLNSLDNWMLLKLYRTIYKNIIQLVREHNALTQTQYCSVLLLIPNVFSQEKIGQLLYELNKLNENKSDGLPLCDFRVISESDAAFLGLKNKLKNGLWLVVDSGKGTTDYSVIKKSEDGVTTLRRGGIIGAGAAIDDDFKSILLEMIHTIAIRKLEKSEICDADVFRNKFEGFYAKVNLPERVAFYQQVENLKKSLKEGKINTPGRTENIGYKVAGLNEDECKSIYQVCLRSSDANPDADALDKFRDSFLNLLEIREEEPLTPEQTELINNTCKLIAKNTLEQVLKDKLGRKLNVLFTGRSFKFAPLKKAFKEQILKEYPGGCFLKKVAKYPNIDDRDLKTCCVRVPHGSCLNVNSNLCSLERMNWNGVVELENFFSGFEVGGNKYYYIDYGQNQFAPQLQGGVNMNQQQGTDKLVEKSRSIQI